MSSYALIDVVVEVTIAAEPTRVFNALTTGVSMWWGHPYLEREDATDLVMEPRIGGRLYERWGRDGSDRSGALLGNIVAIDRPHLLRIQGPFGLIDKSTVGLLSIELKKHKHETLLKLHFTAHGDLDESHQLEYGRGLHDLTGRLKFFVEEKHGQGVRLDPSLQADFDFID